MKNFKLIWVNFKIFSRICLAPTTETRDQLIESNPLLVVKVLIRSEYDKMLSSIGKLSTADFEEGSKEMQLLEDLREWWNSTRSVLNIDANGSNLKTREDITK